MFCTTAFAQTKKADRLYDSWEYFRAAKLYEKKIAKKPSTELYFKLGETYRMMNSYKKQEQAAYDKVNEAGTYSDPEFYLNYGLVLKANGNYDQAKVAFDKYIAMAPSDHRGPFFRESIDIVNDDRKGDEAITVSNVTPLNSESADFAPVKYKDGIVFTTSRKTPGHRKTYGWTGGSYLDIYYAEKGNSDTTFASVEPFGGKHINKKYHDGPASFSKNYDTIYFSRVEKDLKGEEKKTLNIERNKIYVSTLEEDKWTKAESFKHNSKLYSVANPFISPDGTKLYFVSDMPGGFGGTDIYFCNREGDTWSKPYNMGPNINTFNDERYPNLDADGNFYFSSNGYQGYGGTDICVALTNGVVFEKAIPLKYPFNSFADDNSIIFLKDGKTGYISSNRTEGSVGDDDIFYFDLMRDDVDTSLMVSQYTIGYEPIPKTDEVAMVEDTVAKPKAPGVKKDPKPAVAKAIQPNMNRVYFDFDKSFIRPEASVYLDSIVKFMKENQNVKLILGGHTDSPGTPEYNVALSNRRNDSVARYLSSKGVNSNRITAKGYGLSKLVNHCEKGIECSDAEDQLNRRVEFQFVEVGIGSK